MNILFEKFSNVKCSNETFSRFITVTSRFILQLYFLVYRHLELARNPIISHNENTLIILKIRLILMLKIL